MTPFLTTPLPAVDEDARSGPSHESFPCTCGARLEHSTDRDGALVERCVACKTGWRRVPRVKVVSVLRVASGTAHERAAQLAMRERMVADALRALPARHAERQTAAQIAARMGWADSKTAINTLAMVLRREWQAGRIERDRIRQLLPSGQPGGIRFAYWRPTDAPETTLTNGAI